MNNFLNVSILVLATMVFTLAGMVGYLYWQQGKIMSAMNELSSIVSVVQMQPEPEPEAKPEPEPEPEPEAEPESEADDRVSVAEVEVVDSMDEIKDKKVPELREILTKRGIPFGKRDSKSVLLELLSASS